MPESSKEKIENMCPAKKRGCRCVKPRLKVNEVHLHECFCGEKWEEVKT